jgi:ADP-ribose pyrophosphatase
MTPFDKVIFKQDNIEVFENSVGWVRVKSLAMETGAVILPITQDGNYLLVKEPRFIGGVWKNVWNSPRGAGDHLEAKEEVAIRELKEEINIILPKDRLIKLALIYPDSGTLLSGVTLYAAVLYDLDISSLQKSVDEEILEVNEFSKSEIYEMVQSGQISDSHTLTGVFLWENFCKKNNCTTAGINSISISATKNKWKELYEVIEQNSIELVAAGFHVKITEYSITLSGSWLPTDLSKKQLLKKFKIPCSD